MDWINSIVQGVLLGGLYAMIAAGLSLIFGVMRLVNIAHGDLIILAAYLGLTIATALGLYPLTALLIVVPQIVEMPDIVAFMLKLDVVRRQRFRHHANIAKGVAENIAV